MDQPLSRRAWLRAAAGGAAALVAGVATTAAAQQPAAKGAAAKPAKAAKPAMTVYKSPTCGCCEQWIEHLEQAGFAVTASNTDDVDTIKRQVGVPDALASCHTGLVSGYVVEGHVPADAIRRMLREKPSIAGIATPGMPVGSPGMEVPGGRKDAFDVVAFDRKGKTRVWASYR